MKVYKGFVVLLLLVIASTGEELAGYTAANKPEKEIKLQKNDSREKISKYITNKTINRLKNFDDPKKDICLKSLIEEVIDIYGDTYLIIADGKQHYSLIHNLQHNFIHTLFTEPKALKQSEHLSYYNLQIFNNNFRLKDILKKLEPKHNTKFFCIVKNYNEVITIFKQFWKYRLTKIVASILVNQTLYFYTYFPYSSTHCGRTGPPVLIAECSITNGNFYRKEKIFPKQSFDFHKCPVKITFKENIPSAYYTESGKLTGWEVEIMNEIIERMNGIPKYKILKPDMNTYSLSTGYSRLLRKSEAGGGTVVSLRGLTKTDFCMYGPVVCSTWIVPKRKDPLQSISFIWKVFPTPVWLLFLFTIFFMAGAFKLYSKSSYITIVFKLLAYILGTTTRTKKTSRLLGGLWLWFCVTINAIYQSGYQSRLLVPDLPHQLSSTSEIINSDLKIMGVSEIITDAMPYLKARYNISSRRLKLIDRKISYKDWIYRMTVKKDSAFLGFKETAIYHIEKTEWGSKLYIPSSCVVKYFLAFVLRRNSHLTENFMRISNRLNENGFVVFIWNRHLSGDTKLHLSKELARILKPQKGMDDKMPPSIDMDKMLIVFLCLIVGNLLGLLVFFFEITSTWNFWVRIKRGIFKNKQLIVNFNYR